jgi:hypothetical protein
MSDDLEQWRLKQSNELSLAIQKNLSYSQNNLPCTQDRKMYCSIHHPFPCGLGCQVHDIASCMYAAWYTNRVFLLFSKDWNYNAKGFEEYFQPLSETCVVKPDEQVAMGLSYLGINKVIIKIMILIN